MAGEFVRTSPHPCRRRRTRDSGDHDRGDLPFRGGQRLRSGSARQQSEADPSDAHSNDVHAVDTRIDHPCDVHALDTRIDYPADGTYGIQHSAQPGRLQPTSSALCCATQPERYHGFDLPAGFQSAIPKLGCAQSAGEAKRRPPSDPAADALRYLRPRRPKVTHQRRIDRLNPALIVMLVDQSDSMSEPIAGGTLSKSAAVADQINRLIYELVLRCVKTPREPPRPYFYLAVIGYSTDSAGERLVLSGLDVSKADAMGVVSVTDLATNPRRVEERILPGDRLLVRAPIWVEPVSRGGTPMCAALDRGGRIAASWVKRYPKAFPPIIINLSDGESTDGNPSVWSDRIRSLHSEDGSVLLFNINISGSEVAPALFPASFGDSAGEYARELFTMSSVLPPGMVASAQSQGMRLVPGARGFAFNADINALALFLNVGTSVGRVG